MPQPINELASARRVSELIDAVTLWGDGEHRAVAVRLIVAAEHLVQGDEIERIVFARQLLEAAKRDSTTLQ